MQVILTDLMLGQREGFPYQCLTNMPRLKMRQLKKFHKIISLSKTSAKKSLMCWSAELGLKPKSNS